MRNIAVLLLCLFSAAASAQITEYGQAIYYSDNLHGSTTAYGEMYDKGQLSCASRTFGYNSILRVTRMDNNKAVEVRVNDCGPYNEKRPERIIDLSRAAAETLDMIRDGVVPVKIELVQAGQPIQSWCSRVPIDALYQDEAVTAATNPAYAPAPPNTVSTPATAVPDSGIPTAYETPQPELQSKGEINLLVSPASRGNYAIQLASFNSEQNAGNFIAKLDKSWEGNVFFQRNDGATGPTFKVLVGLFQDEVDARIYLQYIKENYKMDGFLINMSAN